MSELTPIFKGKIEHDGIWDWKKLYRFLFDFFDEYQYDLFEKKYKEKITPTGKEIEVEWLGLRKISDYFRFRVKVKFRMLNVKTVEVNEGDAVVKKQKGSAEINFDSHLERDFENRWEGNYFSKFLRGLYDKYIVYSRIKNYEDRLFIEVQEIMGQLKAYLALSGRLR